MASLFRMSGIPVKGERSEQPVCIDCNSSLQMQTINYVDIPDITVVFTMSVISGIKMICGFERCCLNVNVFGTTPVSNIRTKRPDSFLSPPPNSRLILRPVSRNEEFLFAELLQVQHWT